MTGVSIAEDQVLAIRRPREPVRPAADRPAAPFRGAPFRPQRLEQLLLRTAERGHHHNLAASGDDSYERNALSVRRPGGGMIGRGIASSAEAETCHRSIARRCRSCLRSRRPRQTRRGSLPETSPARPPIPETVVIGTGLAADSIGAALSGLSPAHSAAPRSASANSASSTRRTRSRRPCTGSAGAAAEASAGAMPDGAAGRPVETTSTGAMNRYPRRGSVST